MTSCFSWLVLLAAAIFAMASIIRWFEQITEAVDARAWRRTALLLAAPLTVWWFESKVSAGRPTAVPLHEPVRGFGTGPAMPADLPRPAPHRTANDPGAVERLRQKMKQQGMLDDDNE